MAHVLKVLLLLPWHLMVWKVQVSSSIACNSSNHQRALASALTISDPPSCASLCSREWRDTSVQKCLRKLGEKVQGATRWGARGPRVSERKMSSEVSPKNLRKPPRGTFCGLVFVTNVPLGGFRVFGGPLGDPLRKISSRRLSVLPPCCPLDFLQKAYRLSER